MEYDLESRLEQTMSGLAALFLLVGAFFLQVAGRRPAANAAVFAVAVALLVVGFTLGYFRKQFDDSLRIENDEMSMVRRRGASSRVLTRWKKSDIKEMAISQGEQFSEAADATAASLTSAGRVKKNTETVRVVLLLGDATVLEINCKDRAEGESLIEQLEKDSAAKYRRELAAGLVVGAKSGGSPPSVHGEPWTHSSPLQWGCWWPCFSSMGY